ncbi:hypothetical protein EMGBS13_01670 [Actinomycetota bacterium]|nr:hypothetical protein EMGBS13_01670 [Actinomycetota bacterium]
MKKYLPLICALLLSGCAAPSPLDQLTEGNCTQSLQLLTKDHISGQIDAIADQNWQKAYSFAAKSFQDSISLERFTQIIAKEYFLLISNQGYTFGRCEIKGDEITQEVLIKSKKGNFQMQYRLSVVDKKLGVIAAAVTKISEDVAT